MKVTVLGATGLIGKDVVALLNEAGHQTVAASRRSGADVLTGEGLARHSLVPTCSSTSSTRRRSMTTR